MGPGGMKEKDWRNHEEIWLVKEQQKAVAEEMTSRQMEMLLALSQQAQEAQDEEERALLAHKMKEARDLEKEASAGPAIEFKTEFGKKADEKAKQRKRRGAAVVGGKNAFFAGGWQGDGADPFAMMKESRADILADDSILRHKILAKRFKRQLKMRVISIHITYTMHLRIMKVILEVNFESSRLFCALR
jgi:hypothetical protein